MSPVRRAPRPECINPVRGPDGVRVPRSRRGPGHATRRGGSRSPSGTGTACVCAKRQRENQPGVCETKPADRQKWPASSDSGRVMGSPGTTRSVGPPGRTARTELVGSARRHAPDDTVHTATVGSPDAWNSPIGPASEVTGKRTSIRPGGRTTGNASGPCARAVAAAAAHRFSATLSVAAPNGCIATSTPASAATAPADAVTAVRIRRRKPPGVTIAITTSRR